MKTIEQQVEELFENAEDRHRELRRNPVTGGGFVRGVDPIGRQKRHAVKALKARAWFEPQRPPDTPELPLTQWDREANKVGGVRHVIAWFARSLAMRDYETDGHPRFEEYARGVMASPLAPEWIRDDPDLLKRYPPTPLAGLGAGLVWRDQ